MRRRLMLPVALPAGAAVLLFGWVNVRWADDGVPAPLEPGILTAESALLLALAVGSGWARIRSRQARATLTRLSVDVSRSVGQTELRSTLATLLHDPTIKVLYPRSDASTVNAEGVAEAPAIEHSLTVLTRRGVVLAWIAHRPHLLDDPLVLEEITTTAGLALEHERLRAESRAQLASLRASRARIVAASDAERKRLERNLHDGAQQRLVSLALALRLARTTSDVSEDDENRLADRCTEEVTAAIADLRELAHGLFPAALVDEGLPAALQLLSESRPTVLELRTLPALRHPATVESTAYFVVAEILRRCTRENASLLVVEEPPGLVIEMDIDAAVTSSDLTDVEDRLGALDGQLTVLHSDPAHSRLRLELPCAS